MEITLKIHASQKLLLPISHHHMIQGLIYNLIGTVPNYSSFLHDIGYQKNNRKFKGFVFGPLTGKYTISGKTISFDSDVSLIVRSPFEEFTMSLIKGCNTNSELFLGGNRISIESFSVAKTPCIEGPILIETLSPITMHITELIGGASHTRYLSPTDISFSDLIEDNARRKIKALSDLSSDFAFKMSPLPDFRYKKYVTKFKNSIYITGYSGSFFLDGNTEALMLLYDLGLGSNNSQGFGLFKIKTP